jgi:hypothetical protein
LIVGQASVDAFRCRNRIGSEGWVLMASVDDPELPEPPRDVTRAARADSWALGREVGGAGAVDEG